MIVTFPAWVYTVCSTSEQQARSRLPRGEARRDRGSDSWEGPLRSRAGLLLAGPTAATAEKEQGNMAKTKTFSVNTHKAPDTLVSEAKQVAQENDATFEGDAS